VIATVAVSAIVMAIAMVIVPVVGVSFIVIFVPIVPIVAMPFIKIFVVKALPTRVVIK
jgi:hypothetical protein